VKSPWSSVTSQFIIGLEKLRKPEEKLQEPLLLTGLREGLHSPIIIQAILIKPHEIGFRA
jgi:hypothetical protein